MEYVGDELKGEVDVVSLCRGRGGGASLAARCRAGLLREYVRHLLVAVKETKAALAAPRTEHRQRELPPHHTTITLLLQSMLT